MFATSLGFKIRICRTRLGVRIYAVGTYGSLGEQTICVSRYTMKHKAESNCFGRLNLAYISLIYGRFGSLTGGISLIYGSRRWRKPQKHTPEQAFSEEEVPYISEIASVKKQNLPYITQIRPEDIPLRQAITSGFLRILGFRS